MAVTHWQTKSRRRPKSGHRQDTQRAAETMRRLAELEAKSHGIYLPSQLPPFSMDDVKAKLEHL